MLTIEELTLLIKPKYPVTMDHILEQIDSTKPLVLLKDEEIALLKEWARDQTIPA